MATVTWGGHEFTAYDPTTATWNDVPGVYIFAQPALNGWYAKYIGVADSFKTRLPNHERWAEARQAGATQVHAMVVQQAASREAIEQALIAQYQPPLNTHHR
jgi:predicted GIY-YIG superfamily endonuclease